MVEYRGVTTPPHWNAADSRYQSTIDCQFLQAGAGCIKAYHLQITIPLVLVGVRQSKSDSQITRSQDINLCFLMTGFTVNLTPVVCVNLVNYTVHY